MTSRKKKLLLFALLVVLFLFSTNTKLQVEQIEVRFKNLPASMDGFKIVQISDLHLPKNVCDVEEVLRIVSEQAPDIIVLTGDMLNYTADIPKTEYKSFCERITKIADVYAIAGNHERWHEDEWRRILKESGGHIVSGSSVDIKEITLAGVHDGWHFDKKGDGFTILLSNWPNNKNADLIFSGHAHGGVFRIPFVGGIYAP